MEHLFLFYTQDITDPVENEEYVCITNDNIGTNDDCNDFCEEVIREGLRYHFCTFQGCGKTFRFKSEAMRHKLIHTSQKPFECTFGSCRKAFKRSDALRSHMRTHTGEKPYQCEESGCGKSFSNKSGLRYHMFKHKGTKEFTCTFPGCHKTFFTISQLKHHEKAMNCHLNASSQIDQVQDFEEESVRKVRKCSDSFDEFVLPDMESVTDFKWRLANLENDVQDDKVNDDLQEEFERTVKAILRENNAMKEKLSMRKNETGPMKGNKEVEREFSTNLEIKEQRPLMPQDYLLEENVYSFLKFDDQERFCWNFDRISSI